MVLNFMNELWRLAIPEGQLAISTPYSGSYGYWQDPTHCSHFTESSWQLFDPDYPLYKQYAPKPWKIVHSAWKSDGNLEVILQKRKEKGELLVKDSLELAEKAVSMGAIQKPLELGAFLDFIKGRDLDTVVEIGTAKGGVLYALCQRVDSDATIVSIDLPGGSFGGGYTLAEQSKFETFK